LDHQDQPGQFLFHAKPQGLHAGRQESAKEPQRDIYSFYCVFASAEGRFASLREAFFYTIFDFYYLYNSNQLSAYS